MTAGRVAHWYGACSAHVKPWVQASDPKEKTCSIKITKPCQKKSKKTSISGKIACVQGLENLILSGWQSNIPMQCIYHQNFKSVLCRNGKTQSKIHIEFQRSPKSQSTIEKEQSWRFHTSCGLENSYSSEDSVVLANEGIYTGQWRTLEINPHYPQLSDLPQGTRNTQQGKNSLFKKPC